MKKLLPFVLFLTFSVFANMNKNTFKFMSSIEGLYSFGGSEGCENLEINQTKFPFGYAVGIESNDGSVGSIVVSEYTKDKYITLGKNYLEINQRIYTGYFNLKGSNLKIKLKKNSKGDLISVNYEYSIINEYGIRSDYKSFSCSR